VRAFAVAVAKEIFMRRSRVLVSIVLGSVVQLAAITSASAQSRGGFFNDAERDQVSSGFALAAIGLGSAAVATTAVNIIRPTYLGGFLRLMVGAAGIAVGADHLDGNNGTEHVGTVTLGLGVVSAFTGVYALMKAHDRERSRGHGRDRDRWRHQPRRRHDMGLLPQGMQQGSSTIGVRAPSF
jgi:hypothetical protein